MANLGKLVLLDSPNEDGENYIKFIRIVLSYQVIIVDLAFFVGPP